MPRMLPEGAPASLLAVTPFGERSATNAQAALDELETEKGVPEASVDPAGAPFYKRSSGLWYTTPHATSATLAAVLDRLYVVSFHTDEAVTLDRIAGVVTGAIASGVLRLGAYLMAGGRPTALIADYGTVEASLGSPTLKEIIISQAISRGTIGLGCVAQVAAPTVRSVTSRYDSTLGSATAADISSVTVYGAFYQDGVSGALPDPFVIGGLATIIPKIMVRVQ